MAHIRNAEIAAIGLYPGRGTVIGYDHHLNARLRQFLHPGTHRIGGPHCLMERQGVIQITKQKRHLFFFEICRGQFLNMVKQQVRTKQTTHKRLLEHIM